MASISEWFIKTPSKKELFAMKKSVSSNHQSKKDVVLQQQKRSVNPMTIVLGIVFLAVAVTAAYLITDFYQSTTQQGAIVNVKSTAGVIRYPVDMFADGKARHFEYAAKGLTIRYFVIKSADGVIRSAFDACDVCWPAGKGYFQEGDEMVCRNCGRRFASRLVNEVQGGCNPAPLNRSIEGDQLVIKADDIMNGQTYFTFKEKV
jgi:uncharacterized membrane protein